MTRYARPGRIRFFLSVTVPVLLPVAVLVVWLATQVTGQMNQPTQIVASMSSDRSGRTYFTTTLADGAQAVWSCTGGSFLESDGGTAWGRSVTWLPGQGPSDSVTVTMTTPSLTDSISFLPEIPSVVPTITVSPSYHLAILEQSRRISLRSGRYLARLEAGDLEGYDGLVLVICHIPGLGRQGHVVFPGDSLEFEFPLGAEIEAVALDDMEGALDNRGSIILTLTPLEPQSP